MREEEEEEEEGYGKEEEGEEKEGEEEEEEEEETKGKERQAREWTGGKATGERKGRNSTMDGRRKWKATCCLSSFAFVGGVVSVWRREERGWGGGRERERERGRETRRKGVNSSIVWGSQTQSQSQLPR